MNLPPKDMAVPTSDWHCSRPVECFFRRPFDNIGAARCRDVRLFLSATGECYGQLSFWQVIKPKSIALFDPFQPMKPLRHDEPGPDRCVTVVSGNSWIKRQQLGNQRNTRSTLDCIAEPVAGVFILEKRNDPPGSDDLHLTDQWRSISTQQQWLLSNFDS